jgi:hypothetical protein
MCTSLNWATPNPWFPIQNDTFRKPHRHRYKYHIILYIYIYNDGHNYIYLYIYEAGEHLSNPNLDRSYCHHYMITYVYIYNIYIIYISPLFGDHWLPPVYTRWNSLLIRRMSFASIPGGFLAIAQRIPPWGEAFAEVLLWAPRVSLMIGYPQNPCWRLQRGTQFWPITW